MCTTNTSCAESSSRYLAFDLFTYSLYPTKNDELLNKSMGRPSRRMDYCVRRFARLRISGARGTLSGMTYWQVVLNSLWYSMHHHSDLIQILNRV